MRDELGREVILFHLKRFWEGQVGSVYIKDLDLYEEIKAGRKKSEWRDNTEYWRKKLISFILEKPRKEIIDEVVRAWFVCGYPKGNLPRLEATITEVLDVEDSEQLEVKFKDVVEVKDEATLILNHLEWNKRGRMLGSPVPQGRIPMTLEGADTSKNATNPPIHRCRECIGLSEIEAFKFYAGRDGDGINRYVPAYPCHIQKTTNAPGVPACLNFTPRTTPWEPKEPPKEEAPRPRDHTLAEWLDEPEEEREDGA